MNRARRNVLVVLAIALAATSYTGGASASALSGAPGVDRGLQGVESVITPVDDSAVKPHQAMRPYDPTVMVGCLVGPSTLLVPIDSSFTTVRFDGALGDGPPDPADPCQRADDASSMEIALPFTFNFYGRPYTGCYINNNGNLSFGAPVLQYTGTGFPVPGYAIVAPFWSDVDTRNAGSGVVHYRVEPHRLVVVWDHVGYYDARADKTNTFEVVISDGTDPLVGEGRNVLFSYDDMQWTTGDSSRGVDGLGGTPATVGANKGDGVAFDLVGRFDHEGTDFDGPQGNPDGVSHLDQGTITLDLSRPNLPPVANGFTFGRRYEIHWGAPWELSTWFTSPEADQITTTVVDLMGLENASVANVAGQVSTQTLAFQPAHEQCGRIYTVVYTATDDGTPPAVTQVPITIEVVGEPNTITASANAGGTIEPSGPLEVPCGGEQAFTLTPEPLHHVADVVVDGVSMGPAATYAFTGVIDNHTIDVVFALDTYVLSVTVLGGGSVTRAPDPPFYAPGAPVLLTAASDSGWVFMGWSGAASGSEDTVTVVMDGHRAVTAVFGRILDFEFKPHDLNLKSKGKWVTGYVRPPAPFLASQVDVASVRLNGVVPVSTQEPAKIEDHDRKLKVKFARAEVRPTLVPGKDVPVVVTGLLAGDWFRGVDLIKVKAPKIKHPVAGEVLAAGSVTEVTWDVVADDDPPAPRVSLLLSADDGLTWTVAAADLPNTGSTQWMVPGLVNGSLRLAVMDVFTTDETGVVPESEVAVSDVFSIVVPAGVGDGEATLALQLSNPAVGALTIRFSLASREPATLDVYDVGGRRVSRQEVGSSGPGWHTVGLGRLPAGVYGIRLSQSGRTLSSRAVVLH